MEVFNTNILILEFKVYKFILEIFTISIRKEIKIWRMVKQLLST